MVNLLTFENIWYLGGFFFGQLGLGHVESKSKFEWNHKLSLLQPCAMQCGGDTSFFWTDEGEGGMLWGCGYNEDRMLATIGTDSQKCSLWWLYMVHVLGH